MATPSPLVRRILNSHSRVVTVTGQIGSGKTTTAVQCIANSDTDRVLCLGARGARDLKDRVELLLPTNELRAQTFNSMFRPVFDDNYFRCGLPPVGKHLRTFEHRAVNVLNHIQDLQLGKFHPFGEARSVSRLLALHFTNLYRTGVDAELYAQYAQTLVDSNNERDHIADQHIVFSNAMRRLNEINLRTGAYEPDQILLLTRNHLLLDGVMDALLGEHDLVVVDDADAMTPVMAALTKHMIRHTLSTGKGPSKFVLLGNDVNVDGRFYAICEGGDGMQSVSAEFHAEAETFRLQRDDHDNTTASGVFFPGLQPKVLSHAMHDDEMEHVTKRVVRAFESLGPESTIVVASSSMSDGFALYDKLSPFIGEKSLHVPMYMPRRDEQDQLVPWVVAFLKWLANSGDSMTLFQLLGHPQFSPTSVAISHSDLCAIAAKGARLQLPLWETLVHIINVRDADGPLLELQRTVSQVVDELTLLRAMFDSEQRGGGGDATLTNLAASSEGETRAPHDIVRSARGSGTMGLVLEMLARSGLDRRIEQLSMTRDEGPDLMEELNYFLVHVQDLEIEHLGNIHAMVAHLDNERAFGMRQFYLDQHVESRQTSGEPRGVYVCSLSDVGEGHLPGTVDALFVAGASSRRMPGMRQTSATIDKPLLEFAAERTGGVRIGERPCARSAFVMCEAMHLDKALSRLRGNFAEISYSEFVSSTATRPQHVSDVVRDWMDRNTKRPWKPTVMDPILEPKEEEQAGCSSALHAEHDECGELNGSSLEWEDKFRALMKLDPTYTPVRDSLLLGQNSKGGASLLPMSHSGMFEYNWCPKRYYYSRMLKLPQAANPVMLFGSVVHKAFEQFNEVRVTGGEFLEEHKKQVLSGVEKSFLGYLDVSQPFDKLPHGFETREHISNSKEDALRVVEDFLDRNMNRQKQVEIVGVEEKFELVLELGDDDATQVAFLGIYDCIERSLDGKITIVDYKSNTKDRSKLKRMIRTNDLQLAVYAWGYEKTTGKKPYALALESAETGARETVRVENLRHSASDVEEKVFGVVNGVLRRQFAATPNVFKCKHCSFSAVCPEAAGA